MAFSARLGYVEVAADEVADAVRAAIGSHPARAQQFMMRPVAADYAGSE